MKNKEITLLLPILLFLVIAGKADMPPESGYARVSYDLVIETTEDLTDFRFFVDFYGDLKDVEVKSKGRTIIPPMGGGARYSGGTLLAVPVKSLSGLAGELTPEQLSRLSETIKNKKLDGVLELAKHRFSEDIPKGETPENVYYKISREGKTLNAVRMTEPLPKLNKEQELIQRTDRNGLIIGGILLALSALAVGFFIFRNAAKKSKMNL